MKQPIGEFKMTLKLLLLVCTIHCIVKHGEKGKRSIATLLERSFVFLIYSYASSFFFQNPLKTSLDKILPPAQPHLFYSFPFFLWYRMKINNPSSNSSTLIGGQRRTGKSRNLFMLIKIFAQP